MRVVAADRNQEIAAEESVHLSHSERPLGGVEGIEQNKRIAGIIIDLWDLLFIDTVFDG
jgi:hypothetical protein